MGVARGGPRGHAPPFPRSVKILKEIWPYSGRCLAPTNTRPLPIENLGYAHEADKTTILVEVLANRDHLCSLLYRASAGGTHCGVLELASRHSETR